MSSEKHHFFFSRMVAGLSDLINKYVEFENDVALLEHAPESRKSFGFSVQSFLGKKNLEQNRKVFNVLFLCTHNSARSIMAEAILNNLSISAGRFKGYSAGSHPSGKPNPFALECIGNAGLSIEGLRSKDWDEFAKPGAPQLDFVFTVCDNAANEVCPVWPGQPMTAHWGLPDPSQVEGDDTAKRRAFSDTFRHLSARINIFTNLPISKLDKLSLQSKLNEIGKQ